MKRTRLLNSDGLNMIDQQRQTRPFFYLGREDAIFDATQQFIQSKNLDDKQKQVAMKLACLKRMGLQDKEDYASVNLGTEQYFHGDPISPTGKKLPKEKFGIQAKAANPDSGKLHC